MRVYCLSKNSCWVIGIGLIVFCLIHIAAGAGNAAGDFTQAQLPEPTGAYGIGTTVLHLIDDSRPEPFTPEPDDHREIMVQVWYPADKGIAGTTAPYMDAPTSAAVMQSLPEELQGVVPNIYGAVATHAVVSATPAAGTEPFPVLIFSPGNTMFYSAYQALIEYVVSHGYVVAAINHPYVSGVTVFPDGRTVTYIGMEAEDVHPVLVEDIKFLAAELDSVQINGSKLILDADNIGMWGHSLGGSASVEACLQLPQGKGAIDIDGTLWGESHQKPINKPVFLLLAQDHSLECDLSWATAWRHISEKGYMVHIEGATHGTFFDFGLLLSQVLSSEDLDEVGDKLGSGNIDPWLAVTLTGEYIVAFFDTCLKDAPAENITAIDYPEATLEITSDLDLYDGTWRSEGYGYWIQIENGDFTLSQITEMGIVPDRQGQIRNNYIYFEQWPIIGGISFSDDLSFATVKMGIEEIRFEPAGNHELPTVLDETTDPEVNFEVFWHTFEENCALFELAEVDWKALYDHYRPQVDANTTDEDLFNILAAMIAPLKDGHTSILDEVSGRFFISGPAPDTMWTENTESFFKIIASYMDDAILKTESDGLIQYGIIDGSIGYLNILRFNGFTGPESPIGREQYVFEYFIDDVLEKFKNMDGLIIDMRFNGGGRDELALALAGRFTEQKRLAFSKRVRIGDYDEYSAPIQQYFEPKERSFLNKPVILLTSKATVSAAEVFTMAMQQLDDVTIFGETTYGAFSNILSRHLPNGWSFRLSNQRYCSWEGIDYEQQGLPPDIEISGSRAAMEQGKDAILKEGLKALKTKTKKPDHDGSDCFISTCIFK